MNNTAISDAEQIVSEKIAEERAAAAGWTQSFVRQIGDKWKKTGSQIQKASSAAESDRSAAADRPAADRAEESLDRAGEKIGLFAATVSRQVRKSVALAREEAEDMLAEAQSLRRQDR